MGQTRRQFITSAAGTVAATAVLPVVATESKGGRSEVYVGKGSAEEIIPKIFAKLGGVEAFVKKGANVLIKPNMSFANPPQWGTGTSPEAVHVVTKMCLDAGAKRVVICDNTLRNPDQCKRKTGIAKALEGLKGAVIFIPKKSAMFAEKSDSRATDHKNIAIVKELEKADCFISLPAAKSHSAAGVSMNIKGLMGLIRNRSVMHSQMDLHTAIAELLFYMKPHISILDATRALIDNGPAGPGKVETLNTFVGGRDIVAVDSIGTTLAKWYGRTFEGMDVKHIKNAAEMGFGNGESSKISEVSV